MPGLRKIAKMYGGLIAKDAKQTVEYAWDTKKDEPVVVSVTPREEEGAEKKPGR